MKDLHMLDLNLLRKRCAQGEVFDYLHFWGHAKQPGSAMTKACLSLWFDAPFVVDGITYATAEHWMMASKANLFNDDETRLRIVASKDPADAKALGRRVRNYVENLWKDACRRIVTEGNVAKFSQNETLKDFLLSTGSAILVEASPYDRVWGIGLKEDDQGAIHPDTWEGDNMLGFALMDVREILRQAQG
jgi:ribA/ribD-fused uncharacterized protein